MKFKIGGKIWGFRFIWLKDKYGDIDPPDTPNKEIRISTGLPEEKLLEVLIHEFWHGADWSKDEQWIEDRARELQRYLWRNGYRRTKE